MYRAHVHSLNFCISISSDLNIVSFFKSSLKPHAFIPNFKIGLSSKKPLANIKHYQSNKNCIKYIKSSNTYLIYDDWSNEIPIYIILFIYKLFHDNYIKKESPFLVFHASAVAKKVSNIAIIAPTGAGKTTIMFELIAKYGYKMISNNKTLYNCDNKYCYILAGTKGISVRDSLYKKIPKEINTISEEKFVDRKIINIDNKYLAINYEKNRRNIIVIPQLNKKFKKVVRMDDKEAAYYLFPMSQELIHREVLLFGGKQVIPNAGISDKTRQNILTNLWKLISSSEIYQISGDLNFICDNIKKI